MRALYSFPDTLGKPGIGTTAYHQVESLVEQGVEVVVYCTSASRTPAGLAGLVTTLAFRGTRVPHRALRIDRAYRYHDWRVARAIGRQGASFDVLHCWPRAVLASARAARRASIPSLREVPNTHTAYAFRVVAEETRRLGLSLQSGHSHTFERAVLAREVAEYAAADVLLVPSAFSRATFVEEGVEPSKLVLHDYGFDPSTFRPADDGDVRADGRFTVSFVGRCEPRKGLHHALRAWRDSGVPTRDDS